MCFNSTLVQLKEKFSLLLSGHKFMFQFYLSSIKRLNREQAARA